MSDALTKITDELIANRLEKEKYDKLLKEAKAREEALIGHFTSIMSKRGLKSFKTEDDVTLSTKSTPAYYVKDKLGLIETMRFIGWDSLIKEDVNWSTLQAAMNTLKDQATQEGGLVYKGHFDSLCQDLTCSTKKGITIRGIKKEK